MWTIPVWQSKTLVVWPNRNLKLSQFSNISCYSVEFATSHEPRDKKTLLFGSLGQAVDGSDNLHQLTWKVLGIFVEGFHILGLASIYCGVGPPRSSEGQRVLPQAFFPSVEWAFNPQYSILNSFTMTMENQQTKIDRFGTIYWNNSSFESTKWIFALGGVWTLVVYLLPPQKNKLVTCQTNIVWV